MEKGQVIKFKATGFKWVYKFSRGDEYFFRDEEGMMTSHDKDWVNYMLNTNKAEKL